MTGAPGDPACPSTHKSNRVTCRLLLNHMQTAHEAATKVSCKSGLVYCTEGQDSFTAMMSNEASNAEYINEIMGE